MGAFSPSLALLFSSTLLTLSAANSVRLEQHGYTPALNNNVTWPVPYVPSDHRPESDPYCQAAYKFCPGQTPFPNTNADDRILVYHLKAPVWEFRFGKLMGYANVYHDAIGFSNLNTGINHTLEWYELFQLGNCTFPHVIKSKDNASETVLWCNQGAACLYEGVDIPHWVVNGSMVQVTEITGADFNALGEWVRSDNTTSIIYETWTVRNGAGDVTYFDSHDCATFVRNVWQVLYERGAKFISDIPKYTRLVLYSEEPKLEAIATTGQETIEIKDFYRNFQTSQGTIDIVKSIGRILKSVFDGWWHISDKGGFVLYYNGNYYRLNLVFPFFSNKYEEIPYPGTQ
eukprot:comp19636_c0_seq1/m.23185 comp19636_c0_seq1/g.23185  ORF comp19636_c0_seq1/g.23185 comp19636_c0_seq1/m.23185 type:complete len:344 (-) comp19636_c0_seq1:380-1411(-)